MVTCLMWYFLYSKISFEMSLIVVEAMCGRCASFTVLTTTVSEIFGGQTNPSILVSLVEEISLYCAHICIHIHVIKQMITPKYLC